MDVVLLAMIFDQLTNSESGPFVNTFLVQNETGQEADGESVGGKKRFDSADDFEEARNEILRNIRNVNTGNSICTDSPVSAGDQR